MSLSPNCSKYLWPHTFSRIVKLIRNVYSTFYLSETEPQSSVCSLTTSSPPLLILLLLIPVFLFLLTTWRPRSVLAADLAPLLPWNGGGWILLRSTQCNLRSDSECHNAIYAKLSQKKKKKRPLTCEIPGRTVCPPQNRATVTQGRITHCNKPVA